MKFKTMLPMAILSATLAWSQPMRHEGAPPMAELKAYLGLSDTQVTQIQETRKSIMEDTQSVHEQLFAKEKALRETLSTGTADALTVGKAVLEVEALRKQVKTAQDSAATAVKALLTAEQKTKLAALIEAAKLRPAIQQATGAGLIEPEEMPGGPGGAVPHMMGPGGGPGMQLRHAPAAGRGAGAIRTMGFRNPR